MTPGIASSTSTPTPTLAPGLTPPPATAASGSVTKNMFLQLLVAQLKNQDPLNPTDGTQFVTQLAQFQQMEQSVNMGQDIATIRHDMDQLVATAPGTTPVSQP
jgi:flagellar basal-body rod modification protein FlgD